jgi:hypothetical protein
VAISLAAEKYEPLRLDLSIQTLRGSDARPFDFGRLSQIDVERLLAAIRDGENWGKRGSWMLIPGGMRRLGPAG